jgi:predicted TIM-barrel fold metal-dependent hydrolase
MQLHLILFTIFTSLAMATPPQESTLIARIKSNAARDSIDFSILPFHIEALDSIASLSTLNTSIDTSQYDFSKANKIDTHTHPIPPWFRALEPLAAGRATPEWNVSSHLEFMASRGIRRCVLSTSTPQGNAFNSEPNLDLRKKKTIALARLLNEYVAQVCRLWPERFSWLAVTALPYVEESIVEVRYAMGELGAVGVGVLTNAESYYPGEESFDELWVFLNEREEKGVVFIHPTEPVLKLDDGRVVNSRPCKSDFPPPLCV